MSFEQKIKHREEIVEKAALEKFGNKLKIAENFKSQIRVFEIEKEIFEDTLIFFSSLPNCEANMLVDLFATDFPDKENRFRVFCSLLSVKYNLRLGLIFWLQEDTPIQAASKIFPVADWYEREIYDMYGIPIEGRPDIKRILLEENFVGFPMRKDFPTFGYQEKFYDESTGKVVDRPVDLEQAHRNFSFEGPWSRIREAIQSDK